MVATRSIKSSSFATLEKLRRAAKTAAKGNLVINNQAAVSVITAPTTKPSTSGFTNALGSSGGWVASFTGTTTSGSNVITGISSFTGLAVGQPIVENAASSGPYPANIPLGAVITAIDTVGLTVTMSKQATGTASAITIKTQSNRFRLRGGVPGSYGGNFLGVGPTNGNSVNPPTAQTAGWTGYAVEFMADAANLSTAAATIFFYVFQNGVSLFKFRVAIDDVYQSDVVSFDTTGRSGTIQFNSAGVHKVRIELPPGVCLTELWVATGSSIWAPESADDVQVGWYSDSFGLSGASGSWPLRNMGQVAGHILGWNVDMISVGGTGYINNNNTNYNFQSPFRTRDVTLRSYDAIVIAGSVNDSSATSAAEQVAALATWQAIRALFPTKPIFIIGVCTTVNLSAATAATLESGLGAAFAKWGDANAYYIPVTGDPEGAWLSTANTATYIAADGTHPADPIGANYVGLRAAKGIAKAIDAAGKVAA